MVHTYIGSHVSHVIKYMSTHNKYTNFVCESPGLVAEKITLECEYM